MREYTFAQNSKANGRRYEITVHAYDIGEAIAIAGAKNFPRDWIEIPKT